MPFKVQSLLPSIGLELYQLGVHILAKKKKKKKKKDEYHVTTRSKSRLQANAHLTSLKASIIQPVDDVHIIDDPILIVTGSLVHPSTSVT